MMLSILLLSTLLLPVLSIALPRDDTYKTHDKRFYLRTVQNSPGWQGASTLVQNGNTGVSAMQLTVVGNNHVVVIDQAESNPLQINGVPVWVSYYNTDTQEVTGLVAQTNSFCASGSWLSNGTLINMGGNPATGGVTADLNGLQGMRLFNNCGDNGCTLQEWPSTVRLAIGRWYPGTARLDDGSVMIVAGTTNAGGFNQYGNVGNPTYEFFPPKGNGMPVFMQFLYDTLDRNMFPVMYMLSDGNIFMSCDTQSTIYNWRTLKETRLPSIPNAVIVNYPWSSAAVLLPLTLKNAFYNEILMCGGSKPGQDYAAPSYTVSSQDILTTQCVRMVLNANGIKTGWLVEQMPESRIMGTAVMTPDGKVVLVNGAHTGAAGYYNVANQIGYSNADHPAFRATLYDPLAASGSRFSINFPTSTIPRMYHSTAVLIPDGRIMIAGSNPNADVTTTEPYSTEYRVEYLSPPYMTLPRPTFSGLPSNILYQKNFTINVNIPAGRTDISISLMDLGFATHGLTYNQRLLELDYVQGPGNQVIVFGPPNTAYYPPGPGFLFVLTDGIPSVGQKVMVGDGSDPVFSEYAMKYMLNVTSNPDFLKIYDPLHGG